LTTDGRSSGSHTECSTTGKWQIRLIRQTIEALGKMLLAVTVQL
jgi:hypothetical protein